MDNLLSQELFGIVFSLLLILVSIWLLRRGALSFRYAVGWTVLGSLGIISSFFLKTVGPIARVIEIAPSALLAAVGIIVLITICVQLSISISGLHQALRTLTEEVSNLKFHKNESAPRVPNETDE